jgi:hypothetical protein
MRNHPTRTAKLGDLIVAAFDEAAVYSTDPAEVSRLATQAIAHLLRSSARGLVSSQPATSSKARLVR